MSDTRQPFIRRLVPVVAVVVVSVALIMTAVTPAGADSGAPSAPLDVQASAASDTALTNGAVLSWTAPVSAGAGDITSYGITPFDVTSGSTLAATVVAGSPPATTMTVAGLVAGDSYTFTVTAANDIGPSPASLASNAIVPVAVVPSQSDDASSSPAGSATASLGSPGAVGSIFATGSGGEGIVTVAAYPSAPIGGSSVQGTFYDVSVLPGAVPFTQITAEFCGVTHTGTLEAWDTATHSYVAVSDQTAPSGDGRCVTVTINDSSTPALADLTGTVFVVPAVAPEGYDLAGADGGVFSLGDARYLGSLPADRVVVRDVVGLATTADGAGYWLVGADGGVFAFGDARFYGSLAGRHLNAPVVGMAPTSDGGGYWLVAADGGVFAFGDAIFSGSLPSTGTRVTDVTGMAASPAGGYWLVGADGGVFAFGGALFSGSLAGRHLNAPVVGMSPTTDGGGYWLVGSDGGVFALGDAGFFGSLPGLRVRVGDVVAIITSPGGGYLLVGADGGVYAFGNAVFHGSAVGIKLRAAIVGAGT